MDVLLAQTAVDMLPFTAEPFSQWNRKTDIYKFISALYADIYPPFSSYLYKGGRKHIKTWARQFSFHVAKVEKDLGVYDVLTFMVENMASPEIEEKDHLPISGDAQSLSSNVETKIIPSFVDDQEFGRAAKYVVAWRCCVQTLLEEAGFYSLAHILETETEIESSLLLASHTYYKQAVQVLRSFLEELIMPIHFCENVQEFNQWKANNYHTPPLRGRDGLIKKRNYSEGGAGGR